MKINVYRDSLWVRCFGGGIVIFRGKPETDDNDQIKLWGLQIYFGEWRLEFGVSNRIGGSRSDREIPKAA